VRYSVEVAPAAVRQIKKLDRAVQKKILARIERLADVPRPPGCVKLSGRDDVYRVRVADFRILYSVADGTLIVLVLKVGHRRDVYG
jgi:mRNA interferase RelE/StbE